MCVTVGALQSDGTVRLEGTSFGTRQRVSFMRQPRIYVPARPSQPEKVDVQCDPWRGFPPARPSRSFFNFGGCGPSAYGADPGNEVYMQIQHIARDSLPVSFIEDSPPVTVPRRQPSMQSVGTDPPLPIYEETPVPPSSGAPEKQPSSAQLSSEPPQRGSLVRRLSSAIFNIPARARARTSPALLFSVQLRGSSLELVPNPHAAQAAAHLPVYLRSGGSSRVSSAGRSALGMDLKPSQMIKEGEGSQGTAIKETNDSQDDDERVWNESDDSLDRTSFKYMHPEDEVPQHILQDIRRKSSGQSLDSHMFRQQLIETMMFSPTSSSKKTPFSYIQTIDADSSKEHGKMPWSAQGSSRVHPVVPSPAAAAAAGDGAVQVMDVDEDALGDANV